MSGPDPAGIAFDPQARRFTWTVEGHTAFSDVLPAGERLFVTHTEVPPALEGRGIGSALMRHILDHVRERGLRVVPLCPFMAAYLRRHPEHADLIAEGYSV